jgi:hypothetical protein
MSRNSYGFRSREALTDHFAYHKDDENGGFASIDEYGASAYAFLNAPQSDDILEGTRTSRVKIGTLPCT